MRPLTRKQISAGPSRDADAPAGTGEVYAIYLDESAAEQGVGRTLFTQAIGFLRKPGNDAATLWVLASNLTTLNVALFQRTA